VLALGMAGDASALAGTWDGVEIAWRDDHRPAADVPGEFAPAPGRRGSRRPRRATRRSRPVSVPAEAPTATAVPAEAPTATAVPAERPAVRPADSVSAAVTHRGQRYGAEANARQRFDLHLPEGCAGGGTPLVVWIRGTDWRGGQQDDCPLLWLVRHGFAVASIDYRPSDVAQFPAQLDDCRAALATLRQDAEVWGIDPERICIFGRAGGGHLAALVAFATSPPATGTGQPAEPAGDVAAVGAIGAPFHLASLGIAHQRGTSAASRLVGGPLPEFREAARRASPLEHVGAEAPPTLLLHAARDANVPADQSLELDRALKAAGADSTLVLLDGDAAPVDAESPSGLAIRQFLERVIGSSQAHAPR
jgi:acetyl esterase/lipase